MKTIATRLVIVGATGMVGGSALRYALDNPAVEAVTAIGRRRLGISHPKLREVSHQDFADCSALADALTGQDGAVFCLGAYTGAVPDTELRKVTVDYAIAFARAFHTASPAATFSFLSGGGADRPDEAGWRSLATRERPKTRCSRQDLSTCTSSGPRTSIRCSRARNRISVTGYYEQSIPRFGCCSPIR